LAVDGIEDSYWLSAPDAENSSIKVLFDHIKSFSKVEIDWKYPASSFTI